MLSYISNQNSKIESQIAFIVITITSKSSFPERLITYSIKLEVKIYVHISQGKKIF